MSNEFAKAFIDLARDRFSIDSINMSNSEWVCKNTTLRNRPFSMRGYEFQRKIMDDMHPNLTCIKISQVGLTEIQIRKALAFLVRNNGTSLIFSLPNEDMFQRVSNSRVKPIINKDKVFNTPQDKETKSVRSVGMMQFGQSFLYLVPAIESSATSIPADMVINDELDLCDQQIVALFNSRLQNSKYKISQRFGTPTFPSFGVDLDFRASDQQLYMCKCRSCGHWAHPEFTRDFIHLPGIPDDKLLTEVDISYADDLDFDNAYVKCPKCNAALDLDSSDTREWVATYPNRVNQRGYRIGPFSTSKLNIAYIYKNLWEYSRNEYMRGFHNTVLGLPYSDGNLQIPEEDILKCMRNPAPQALEGNLVVGIDMGQTCHVTLGRILHDETFEVLNMYTVKVGDIIEHCKDLCEKHNIVAGALDRHPYEPTSREIFKVTGGKILPVEYRGTRDTNIILNEYQEVSHAQVNRTWFLDSVSSLIRKQKLIINGYGHQKRIIIEHLRDMVREEKPGEPATWTKLTGNDHYFHSTAFMVVAPYFKDLIRLKLKQDNRTMVLGVTANIKSNTQNLMGISNKRLDIQPLKG